MTRGTQRHRDELGTLVLTQGTLNIDYPNRLGGNFPKGVMSRMIITDSSGAQLDEWDGWVRGDVINYTVEFDEHQYIPVGAQYALFVTWKDGHEYQWEHGYVTREQVQWPNAAARQPENQPLTFSYIPGTAVGSRWLKKGGTGGLKSWDNSIFGLPRGLGIDNAFFFNAAALWDTPLATASAKIVVNTLNGGAGKSGVAFWSDINMTSYVAVQFETGIVNNKIHIVHGTGPVTMTDLVTPVGNIVGNSDTYPIIFDEASKTVAVYKGTTLTPLISTPIPDWIPMGQGYNHGGVNFLASLAAPGTEFSYWSMKDN
ncbi:hypothetical protein B1R94_25930 [Mycolicibacterium litorale]|nr:hypothetical protein B1R94_25930 [Mycolicibacterium litorale]